MDSLLDCYEALTIPTDADKQAILDAHERLMMLLDSAPSNSGKAPVARAIVTAACAILSDPLARIEYEERRRLEMEAIEAARKFEDRLMHDLGDFVKDMKRGLRNRAADVGSKEHTEVRTKYTEMVAKERAERMEVNRSHKKRIFTCKALDELKL